MPGRDGSGESGFTLIELLLAITVLAMVTVPLMSLFAGGYAAAVTAGRQTMAVNLCRDRIEEIKAGGYDGCSKLMAAGGSGVSFTEDPVPGFSLFRRRTVITVEEWPEFSGAKLIRLTVTVSWWQGEKEHTVMLETCLYGGTKSP